MNYEQMLKETKTFYEKMGIKIPDEYAELAVRSLTMPQYANEYKNKFHHEIKDHTALATVGDAVCGALLMVDSYSDEKTKEALTKEKDSVTNESLNIVGEKLLKSALFARNNDLVSSNDGSENKKGYATAFEAVIGFLALLDKVNVTNTAAEIFKSHILKKERNA